MRRPAPVSEGPTSIEDATERKLSSSFEDGAETCHQFSDFVDNEELSDVVVIV